MPLEVFGRTKRLQQEIDAYHDALSEAAIGFQQAVEAYLTEGTADRFQEKLKQVGDLESRGDELRRDIERDMYAETLLPESRGDILELFEALDNILNRFEEGLWYFDVETPDIPSDLQDDFSQLTELCCKSVESLVLASRAYFHDSAAIKDHLHKVRFYESDADAVVSRLRRAMFAMDIDLARKLHLGLAAKGIADVSDMAEDAADKLVIFHIKRSA
ncbi:MAG: DUF47 family protein [Alphaproteobacteria bacterium]|nr:DUF47 family protein [Alphaproteobacteria bacterium]